LGREIEPIIKKLITSAPQKFAVAEERVLLQGVVVDIDEASGRARSIMRISEPSEGREA
jgi:calcineurin-like phosphoesterase